MAIAPSNNLLSALSQLQGAQRAANAAQPRPSRTDSAQNGFAAQFARPANAIRAAAPAAAPEPTNPPRQPYVAASTPVNQPPIPTRGGYLGQHINIVV